MTTRYACPLDGCDWTREFADDIHRAPIERELESHLDEAHDGIGIDEVKQRIARTQGNA
jgi:hypothetical protein